MKIFKYFYNIMFVIILSTLSYSVSAQEVLTTAPRGLETEIKTLQFKVMGQDAQKKYFDLTQQGVSLASNQMASASGADVNVDVKPLANYTYVLTFKDSQKQQTCVFTFQMQWSSKAITPKKNTCNYKAKPQDDTVLLESK